MAQPTPQQQRDSNLTPLQILPAMLHAVFCQTADVFNAPRRQQPRAVIYTNAQIRTSVSVCNERFQYALDLLEMDILKAKATLRRDLSHIRAQAAAEVAKQLALEEAARARLEATAAYAAALRRREEDEAAAAAAAAVAAAAAAAAATAAAAAMAVAAAKKKKADAERARRDTVMVDAPAPLPPVVVPPPPLAPPAPMAMVPVPGNFDDFLASLPVGVDHEGVDGSMGGGQPLGETGLFGSEFDDLFGYGGT